MTNQVTLNLEQEQVVFLYDEVAEGNLYVAYEPWKIKQNFQNFTIENPFPDRNMRYSLREGNVFIATQYQDGFVLQFLLLKDIKEKFFKNHEDENMKHFYHTFLKFAFELRKQKTFGDLIKFSDKHNN
jgi:hypothetical protein